MRSIAIINQKGGVGKTTTAVNLSAALARCGQRVGLIDIDPQAHASLHLGIDPQAKVPTVYDVLTEDTRLADAWQRAGSCRLSAIGSQPNLPKADSRPPTAISPAEESLHVAASHIDLAAAEVELAGVVGREVILRDKLAECAADFDYVLIDCPPSLGILTINALAAVDDVFLPLQPHFLALHGLSKLLKTIGLVNERLNDRLQLAGVVLCLYESGTKLASEVSRDVEQFFRDARKAGRHTQAGTLSAVRLFETRIRRNIRLAEAPSFGQSIFQYAPTSPGAEDYRALGGEVLAYYAGRAVLEQTAA
jgi:chromosome partitioning protein